MVLPPQGVSLCCTEEIAHPVPKGNRSKSRLGISVLALYPMGLSSQGHVSGSVERDDGNDRVTARDHLQPGVVIRRPQRSP